MSKFGLQEDLLYDFAWAMSKAAWDGYFNKQTPNVRGRELMRVIAQQLTGLSNGSRQLTDFVTFLAQRHPALLQRLEETTDYRSTNDLLSTTIRDRGQLIRDEYETFKRRTREEYYDEDQPQSDYRKQTVLRRRYYQPGESVGVESTMQAVNDVANANLFSYRIPNDGLGNNNSLYLTNKQNEHLLLSGHMGLPRPPNMEDARILPFQTLDQYDSDQPVNKILHDRLVDEIGGAIEQQRMSGRSFIADHADDSTRFMEPVVKLPTDWRSASQNVQPTQLDVMRDVRDPIRQPFQRPLLLKRSVPIMNEPIHDPVFSI